MLTTFWLLVVQGVYGKQVSAFFQALSSNTTVRDNVFHGGPRAHINLK